MQTDRKSRDMIVFIICLILLALLVFITVNKSSTATAAEVSIPQVEQKRDVTYEELIHAYNMVLHRVLIDQPSYFEDVLTESEEFCRLNCLLFPEDKTEIFVLDASDSIEYKENWLYEMQGEPDTFKSRYE